MKIWFNCQKLEQIKKVDLKIGTCNVYSTTSTVILNLTKSLRKWDEHTFLDDYNQKLHNWLSKKETGILYGVAIQTVSLCLSTSKQLTFVPVSLSLPHKQLHMPVSCAEVSSKEQIEDAGRRFIVLLKTFLLVEKKYLITIRIKNKVKLTEQSFRK